MFQFFAPISWGFFLCEANMLISRCCQYELYRVADYFICEKCYRACDTVIEKPSQLDGDVKHAHARVAREIEKFTRAT